MKLESTRFIRAEPEVVWEHLVSVEVLRQCIPGCQSMEQTGDNEYALTMKSKIGPVSATFKGNLSLRDIKPGESYTLYFEGSGGAAGFASGSSEVRLERAEGGTNLIYSADAKIGGKIAQLGQRLVDGAARKMANDFFNNFEQAVVGEEPETGAGGEAAAAGTAAERSGGNTWLWVGGIVVLIVVIAWAMN